MFNSAIRAAALKPTNAALKTLIDSLDANKVIASCDPGDNQNLLTSTTCALADVSALCPNACFNIKFRDTASLNNELQTALGNLGADKVIESCTSASAQSLLTKLTCTQEPPPAQQAPPGQQAFMTDTAKLCSAECARFVFNAQFIAAAKATNGDVPQVVQDIPGNTVIGSCTDASSNFLLVSATCALSGVKSLCSQECKPFEFDIKFRAAATPAGGSVPQVLQDYDVGSPTIPIASCDDAFSKNLFTKATCTAKTSTLCPGKCTSFEFDTKFRALAAANTALKTLIESMTDKSAVIGSCADASSKLLLVSATCALSAVKSLCPSECKRFEFDIEFRAKAKSATGSVPTVLQGSGANIVIANCADALSKNLFTKATCTAAIASLCNKKLPPSNVKPCAKFEFDSKFRADATPVGGSLPAVFQNLDATFVIDSCATAATKNLFTKETCTAKIAKSCPSQCAPFLFDAQFRAPAAANPALKTLIDSLPSGTVIGSCAVALSNRLLNPTTCSISAISKLCSSQSAPGQPIKL